MYKIIFNKYEQIINLDEHAKKNLTRYSCQTKAQRMAGPHKALLVLVTSS